MPSPTRGTKRGYNVTEKNPDVARAVAAAEKATRKARAHATILKGHLSALKLGMPKLRSLSKSRSRSKNRSRKA
jgi:imidazolonepropionase-like amidohydrolase